MVLWSSDSTNLLQYFSEEPDDHRQSVHIRADTDRDHRTHGDDMHNRQPEIPLFNTVLFQNNNTKLSCMLDAYLTVHWPKQEGGQAPRNTLLDSETLAAPLSTYETDIGMNVALNSHLEPNFGPKFIPPSLVYDPEHALMDVLSHNSADQYSVEQPPHIVLGPYHSQATTESLPSSRVIYSAPEHEAKSLGVSHIQHYIAKPEVRISSPGNSLTVTISFVDNSFLRIVQMGEDSGIYKLLAFRRMRSLDRMLLNPSYRYRQYSTSPEAVKSDYSRFAPRITLEEISRFLGINIFSSSLIDDILTWILDMFVTLHVPDYPRVSLLQAMKPHQVHQRLQELHPYVRVYFPGVGYDLLYQLLRKAYDSKRLSMKKQAKRQLMRYTG